MRSVVRQIIFLCGTVYIYLSMYIGLCHIYTGVYTAVQSQKAVSAYFTSKQISYMTVHYLSITLNYSAR